MQLEEARLSRAYQGALDRLAVLAEQREDWQRAIAFVQQITLLDPIDEQAQQRLMLRTDRAAMGTYLDTALTLAHSHRRKLLLL